MNRFIYFLFLEGRGEYQVRLGKGFCMCFKKALWVIPYFKKAELYPSLVCLNDGKR
jgi:hypothetical protein